MTFYVVRYSREVPADRRPHAPTIGRWASWLAAEDHRLAQTNAADLEVQSREEEVPAP